MELREAIDAALEAAHPGYREATQQVQRSATVLLVAGLIYLGFGLLAYLVNKSAEVAPPTREESWSQISALIENVVIGCALLACHRGTKRAPGAAFGVALGICMAVPLLSMTITPSAVLLTFLSASSVMVVFWRIGVIVLLILGALAAHRQRRIRAEVARMSIQTGREGPL